MNQANQPQGWSGFLRSRDAVSASPPRDAFAGRRILITGAGGYIGSALARSLARCSPASLVLLDIAEAGLYDLEQEFAGTTLCSDFIVGSCCDSALLRDLFARTRPQIVFHAAALKHVPLMEANPFAAAETNALGTRAVADAAARFGADRLVLLSTDKAVDPISIMGATKRIAELIVLADASPTRMHALRLGNVLGSTGSVAPLFARQIAQGKPLTVTHAEATRYFLSIDDAVTALLHAASGDYPAGILLPDTGAPYRIVDLAHFLLADAGQAPNIRFTGLRFGDKLHEQMISATESETEVVTSFTPLRHLQSPATASPELRECLDRIATALNSRDLDDLFSAIMCAVPEYAPSELLRARSLARHA